MGQAGTYIASLQNYIAYAPEVVSASDYYPFGLEMQGRGASSDAYRYGFNGKENDREWGESLIQDYGFRLYSPAIGKFLSVDPLAPSYPWNSTYAFAENRVIDGVDLDGLEYMVYTVLLDRDGKTVISKVKTDDFRNSSEEDMNRIHNYSNFYTHYSKGFGSEGRGVKYNYYIINPDIGANEFISSKWEVRQRHSVSPGSITRHGLFYGPGAITTYGPIPSSDGPKAGKGDYNFSETPIDMVDAIARMHDIEEDIVGFKGNRHYDYTAADIRFVRRLEMYLKSVEEDENYIDPFTGRAPSKEAINAAKNALNLFKEGQSWFVGLFHGSMISNKKKALEGAYRNKKITKAEYDRIQEEINHANSQDLSLPTPND